MTDAQDRQDEAQPRKGGEDGEERHREQQEDRPPGCLPEAAAEEEGGGVAAEQDLVQVEDHRRRHPGYLPAEGAGGNLSRPRGRPPALAPPRSGRSP